MVLFVLPHHAECQRIGTNNKNMIQYLEVGKHRSKSDHSEWKPQKNCIFRQNIGKNEKSVKFALPALPCRCRTNLASYCLDIV